MFLGSWSWFFNVPRFLFHNLSKTFNILTLFHTAYCFLKRTHPAQTIFQYVEQQCLAITVLYVFLLRNVIKKKNQLSPKFSRDSVCLKITYRKRKVYLKTAYRKRKVYLKSAYQKRNLLSNIVPEKKFTLKYCTGKGDDSQILVPKKLCFFVSSRIKRSYTSK
jgi:hypothetical protein